MKFTYPAVFHKTEQGTYEGYFPDLACCYAKGDTLDEALEDAIHSAYDWISLELTEEELSAADLNHDGVCNVLDLVKLKRMLLEG